MRDHLNGERVDIPAREGRAIVVSAGELLAIVDPTGGQIGDLWAFCREDTTEYLSAEHTRVSVGKLFPALREDFVTNRRRPILRLEEDRSPGTHDMLIAACDPTRYKLLGHQGWHASCEQNLQQALASVKRGPVITPQPINLFMNTPFLPDGNVQWLEAPGKAGDHVVLRVLLDCYVVVSACPQDMVGINAQTGPLAIVRTRSGAD